MEGFEFLIKIILVVFSVISIINPKLAWELSEGWKFKNAEPSNAYLISTRIGAVFVLLFVLFI